MIRIRSLNEGDVVAIRRWPQYPGDMEQMDYALRENGWLTEFRSKPGAFLYAAEDGEDLVGFTILALTGEKEAEFRIAVRADRTGRRLGEGMTMETLRIGFEDLGLSRVHLMVRKNNTRGIGLYRRIGFAERGECLKDILGVPVEFLVMEIGSVEFGRLKQVPGRPGQQDGEHASPQRALLVIDVQNDYVGGKLPIEYPPVELSLANIGRAMDAARAAGVPVVAVQNILPEGAPIMARGTPGAELHTAVTTRGWDHYILKTLPSAFAGTGIEEWLREREIGTITIVGYMTHNCDLSTVIQAVHAGFAVEFISDATGSLPYANRAGSASAEEIHRVVTVVMQSRFAAVMTTDEWIGLLNNGAQPERDTIIGSNRRAISSRIIT